MNANAGHYFYLFSVFFLFLNDFFFPYWWVCCFDFRNMSVSFFLSFFTEN